MVIFNGTIKRILQSKLKLVVLLVMPIIFIVMFGLQNQSAFPVGVVDKDNSEFSKKLIESLKREGNIKLINLKEDRVYDKAVSYQVEYTLIIEPGFEEALLAGKNPEVKEFYIAEKEKTFYVRNHVENFLGNIKLLALGVNYDKAKFSSALKEYEDSKLSVTNKSEEALKVPQARLALGFLVQFMLYMSVITGGVISEDKNNGVFYRVFYAPISIKKYLFENLSAFLMVAVVQVMAILFLINSIFGLSLGGSTISMYILFQVFAVVCVALGLLIISLVKKPLFAYMLITFITTPLTMLGGCYWPKDLMPEILNRIGLLLPTSWVMSGVDKLLYESKGIMDIGLEILVLLIFAGIFMAGGLFRKVDVSK